MINVHQSLGLCCVPLSILYPFCLRDILASLGVPLSIFSPFCLRNILFCFAVGLPLPRPSAVVNWVSGEVPVSPRLPEFLRVLTVVDR